VLHVSACDLTLSHWHVRLHHGPATNFSCGLVRMAEIFLFQMSSNIGIPVELATWSAMLCHGGSLLALMVHSQILRLWPAPAPSVAMNIASWVMSKLKTPPGCAPNIVRTGTPEREFQITIMVSLSPISPVASHFLLSEAAAHEMVLVCPCECGQET
jgi:hypothetical protein